MEVEGRNDIESQSSAPWVTYAKKAAKKPDLSPKSKEPTKKWAKICPKPPIETFSTPPLFFFDSECPPQTKCLDICQASIRMLGCNGVVAAQKFGPLWHLYPSSLENRAKLAGKIMAIRDRSFTLRSKNPSILVNEYGQPLPATQLSVGGIPLFVFEEKVMEALLEAGVKPRSPLAYDQVILKESVCTSWYSGQRSLYIDIPDSPLPDHLNISSFICQLDYSDNVGRRQHAVPKCGVQSEEPVIPPFGNARDQTALLDQGGHEAGRLAAAPRSGDQPKTLDQPGQGKPITSNSPQLPLDIANLANNRFFMLDKITHEIEDGELTPEREEGELPEQPTPCPAIDPDLELSIKAVVVEITGQNVSKDVAPSRTQVTNAAPSAEVELEDGELPMTCPVRDNSSTVVVDEITGPNVSNDVAPTSAQGSSMQVTNAAPPAEGELEDGELPRTCPGLDTSIKVVVDEISGPYVSNNVAPTSIQVTKAAPSHEVELEEGELPMTCPNLDCYEGVKKINGPNPSNDVAPDTTQVSSKHVLKPAPPVQPEEGLNMDMNPVIKDDLATISPCTVKKVSAQRNREQTSPSNACNDTTSPIVSNIVAPESARVCSNQLTYTTPALEGPKVPLIPASITKTASQCSLEKVSVQESSEQSSSPSPQCRGTENVMSPATPTPGINGAELFPAINNPPKTPAPPHEIPKSTEQPAKLSSSDSISHLKGPEPPVFFQSPIKKGMSKEDEVLSPALLEAIFNNPLEENAPSLPQKKSMCAIKEIAKASPASPTNRSTPSIPTRSRGLQPTKDIARARSDSRTRKRTIEATPGSAPQSPAQRIRFGLGS